MTRTSAPASYALGEASLPDPLSVYRRAPRLSSPGRFTHSWMPWKPAGLHQPLGRRLDVQDPRAGRHPLGVAVGDRAAAAVGVLVLEDAVDHVGDRLEAAVRVPRRALGLPRRVLHL